MKKVILLSGKSATGKDTSGLIIKRLLKNTNVELQSFASPMKEFLISSFNFPRENMYGPSSARNEPTKYIWDNVAEKYRVADGNLTYRDFLKLIGGAMREFMPDFWAFAALEKARIFDGVSVLCDTRMKNEVDVFECSELEQITIRLLRKTQYSYSVHETETNMDSWDFYPHQVDFSNCLVDLRQHKFITPTVLKMHKHPYHYMVDNNGSLKELESSIESILVEEGIL